MSVAGIRSNRGDLYQTLVAFDWALTVLVDHNYHWLEIDSITYSVDDVVVGKVDGTQIGCQCKKNHNDFKAWTIADLADELEKAAHLLTKNQKAEVRFYSRNNFGALAKLREHSTTQYDEISYRASLGKEHQTIDSALSERLAASSPHLSTLEFLRRTKFVTTDEVDRMEELLRERLRNIVSNPGSAFTALWARLDQLGARIGGDSLSVAVQHRLTAEDLKAILHKAGAVLVPPMNVADIRLSFSSTSAIGRSWRRDIAGERIPSPTVNEVLAAIDAKKRSILLTGLPGSGKTCVMLAVQEILEERVKSGSEVVPLFIQSREFADLSTSQDRQTQGLSEQWVEKSARMSEHAHVIVIIDSLDVLSIARDHRVLKYFLAQIDRLLLIFNITVVTACRNFDRHYDRRISERKWDVELKCQPLDWNAEISPLLEHLGIATAIIDVVTRELIKNPRELALFVELAQREGTFNIVTSQALAQRYLDTVVRASDTLGDAAVHAIETIAWEMLKLRSLAVPHQRFIASQSIQRELCSLNVLQETQDGNLTFGHQTLLDVFVISRAMRIGVTLSDFIQGLPPVPFVRPSIRSFVAQLAKGERREFRKQIRAVLTGCVAFHIRRLVAESFAEHLPQDDDWALIRDLRNNHRNVFQVIYSSGVAIEWHRFWLRHLVPVLKAVHDAEGLMGHVHRIAQWSNEDTACVLSFWTDVVSLDWLNCDAIADRLGIYLSEIKPEKMSLVAPLLKRLLDMPRSEHSFLGRVIARCLTAGISDDTLLWRYIAGDIGGEDLLSCRFDKELRCSAHEFGDRDDNFFGQRMEQSSFLLDLVLDSIEQWSTVRASYYGGARIGYSYGFLSNTSYENTHSKREISHTDSMDVLFDAVENSILHNAKIESNWWRNKRERLCFNHEGALVYFAILACTASPEANIDLIGRMLCDPHMLASELSYELGTLLQSAFKFLDTPTQDAVMANILTVWDSEVVNEHNYLWILKARAELIVPIPCCLRSPDAQAVVDAYEKRAGILIRQPFIHSHGGTVSAPFSFEIFLGASDNGVLNLLEHYDGVNWCGHEYLVGGEREVGLQLQEASSRHPTRFLGLLSANWMDIHEKFRDDIMDGVVSHLAYCSGYLQANSTWSPVETPNELLLASRILDELEKHPKDWRRRRSTAKALEACANVLCDAQEAERLIFLAIDFEGFHERDPIKGDNVDLISLGINMAKGNVADALVILVGKIKDCGGIFPELLIPTLRRFSRTEHPAIRALILRRLPYLQNKMFDLGWDLFHLVMQKNIEGIWKIAEPCLYYAYHEHFEVIRPLLARLRNEGCGKDLETWGRISALATLSRHVELTEFLGELNSLNSTEAWRGAANVWTNTQNIRLHHEQCLAGIDYGLNAGGAHARIVAEQMDRIFREKVGAISVPIELIRRCFSVLAEDCENKDHRIFGFHEWLNMTAQLDPEHALDATEIYLTYVSHSKPYLYDHENNITQLMTRLFAEAEEREESDCGFMLQRVVVVQDRLLSMGLNGVVDWLKAAERP